jgi:hypothetical protein
MGEWVENMNGKGSSPRNCFSAAFRRNYKRIRWGDVDGEILTKNEHNKRTEQKSTRTAKPVS